MDADLRIGRWSESYIYTCTVKPAHVITSIKQSPVQIILRQTKVFFGKNQAIYLHGLFNSKYLTLTDRRRCLKVIFYIDWLIDWCLKPTLAMLSYIMKDKYKYTCHVSEYKNLCKTGKNARLAEHSSSVPCQVHLYIYKHSNLSTFSSNTLFCMTVYFVCKSVISFQRQIYTFP